MNKKELVGRAAENNFILLYKKNENIELERTSTEVNIKLGIDLRDNISVPNKLFDVKNNPDSYVFQYNQEKGYASSPHPFRSSSSSTHIAICVADGDSYIIMTIQEYFDKWFEPGTSRKDVVDFLNHFQGQCDEDEYNRRAFKVSNYLKGILADGVVCVIYDQNPDWDYKVVLKKNR